jgi:hypothetical protein
MKSSATVYPINDVGVLAAPVAASQNGTTGAVSATLAAAASRLTYISGFEATFSNPTAATTITITVTNTVGGPLNYMCFFGASAKFHSHSGDWRCDRPRRHGWTHFLQMLPEAGL